MTADLGQKIVALIDTAAPISVERFVDYPQLGRFTLRDEGWSNNVSPHVILTVVLVLGRTVAIGKVSGHSTVMNHFIDHSQITKLIESHLEEATEGMGSLSVG